MGRLFNDREDIGTDLLLNVRTSQGLELGLLIAAQVKTGPSFFREPTKPQAGEPEGWWFRDTARSHLDSWSDHVLPHLIILYDDRSRQAYWAHVTADSIRSTGKGARSCSRGPSASTPRTEPRSLVSARASRLPPASRARPGAAWSRQPLLIAGAMRLSLRDSGPPTPNLGFEDSPIRPEQGVALLGSRCRLPQLPIIVR